MSSNLTTEAKLAYGEFLDAKTLDDKISKLEQFLSLVPKHKATERIVALNKTRLSKLKAEREDDLQRRKALAAAVEDPFMIKKEPQAIQIMMISDYFNQDLGAGKSSLIRQLTGVTHVRPGLFTAEPVVGIYEWNHIKFQLIEEPALHESHYLSRVFAGLQTTDIIAIVIDLSRDVVSQMNHVLSHLKSAHIYLNRKSPHVKIEKTGSGGIQVFLMTKDAQKNENIVSFIQEMAEANGISHATIKIYDKLSIEEIEMVFNRASRFKPAIILATKGDLPHTEEKFKLLTSQFGEKTAHKFSIFPVAILVDENSGDSILKGLDSLPEQILQKLELIRVYTKSKKGVAEKPLIVPKECSVGDVALRVHKDLYNTFKFAYVFRKKDDGQEIRIRAGLKFPVEEFDIIEIYSRV